MEIKFKNNKIINNILTLIVAPVVTGVLLHIYTNVDNGNAQAEIWSNANDSNCYAEQILKKQYINKNGYKVYSYTCETGNTFVSITSPTGLRHVKWILFDTLLNNRKTTGAAIAAEPRNSVIKTKIKNNIIYIVFKTPRNQCFLRTINIRTGKILRTRYIKCPN